MSLGNDRGGPVPTKAASRLSITTDTTIPLEESRRPRCRRCGRVLFTAESIRLGIGWDCRRGRTLEDREGAA